MAIVISTTTYQFTHGRKPQGRGAWAFNIPTKTSGMPEVEECRTVMAPLDMTFTEACAWVRQTLRRDGWQDATVHVGA